MLGRLCRRVALGDTRSFSALMQSSEERFGTKRIPYGSVPEEAPLVERVRISSSMGYWKDILL